MTSHESELISPSTTDSPTQAGDISPKSHHSPTGTVFESEAPVEQKVEPPAIVDEQFQVHLEGLEDPKNLPSSRKWLATLVICSAACCVTCVSSVVSLTRELTSIHVLLTLNPYLVQAAFTQKAQQKEFHVSSPVTILGISLYVEGLGIGPLLLGPLSEFFGRNPVYWISYGLFFIFNIPVAVAPNIGMHLPNRNVSLCLIGLFSRSPRLPFHHRLLWRRIFERGRWKVSPPFQTRLSIANVEGVQC